VFGTSGFGWFLAKLLVLMVLSSAAASTLTTILPTARTSLSMAAYKSIPSRFARIHPRYLTPTWSTVGMAVASIAFYVVMTLVSTNVLGDTISSLGVMIAFYYGLTGLTCAWWFRHEVFKSVGNFLAKGLVPFLGGAVLFGFMIYGLKQFWSPNYGTTSWTLPFSPHWHIGGVFLTGAGALLLGVVLMVIYRIVAPPFFKGETLDRETPVLVPESEL
jgi:amino acid transporter